MLDVVVFVFVVVVVVVVVVVFVFMFVFVFVSVSVSVSVSVWGGIIIIIALGAWKGRRGLICWTLGDPNSINIYVRGRICVRICVRVRVRFVFFGGRDNNHHYRRGGLERTVWTHMLDPGGPKFN